LIATAQRPIILAGHGVILAEAYDELRAFAERTDIPVSTTLLGISAFPESHPLSIGWPGMHGRLEVNQALHHSDLIVAIGMRFDDRVTGNTSHFAPHAQLIHIDIDPSEMGKVFTPTVPLVADARTALRALLAVVSPTQHAGWQQQIQDWRVAAPRVIIHTPDDPTPQPFDILAAIRQATDGRGTIVTDVGQHQMWTAGFYGFDHPNTHLTSGGLGTMGYALPAAMGAAMGRPGEAIWVIAGDGGIQMNIQELATIVGLDLPIKVAILNNGYLGMVRQWQEFFHQGNYSETRITGPDYVKLAEAYGAAGFQVRQGSDVAATVAQAMRIAGPVIIDFVIEQQANVLPMVPPGKANIDMIQPPPTTGAHA
nr:acetolactate synthase large subunit [Ktedonobacterales bacterium]